MTDTDKRIAELEAVCDAAAALMRHYEKSVNVGPLTTNPTKEAALIRNLRTALAAETPSEETTNP